MSDETPLPQREALPNPGLTAAPIVHRDDARGEVVKHQAHQEEVVRLQQVEAELRISLSLQRLQTETMRIQRKEDWPHFLDALYGELKKLVRFEGCGVAMVDLRRRSFYVWEFSAQGIHRGEVCAFLPPSLEERVRAQQPVYRRNRQEVEAWGDHVGAAHCSVIEGPFAGGTLALSSAEEDGFSEGDLLLLERVVPLLSDAYLRLQMVQHQEAVRQVRQAVWQMAGESDIRQVVQVLQGQMDELEVSYRAMSVNVIDPATEEVVARYITRVLPSEVGEESFHSEQNPTIKRGAIVQFWREGVVAYRPNLRAEDRYGERSWADSRQPPVLSVVDVPFSHGTLALSRSLPEAFSPSDIALLQELAGVLSEGFGRLKDLQCLAQRTQEAESLSAAIAAVAGTADLEQIFQMAVNQAARMLSAERSTLFLYDAQEGILVPKAQVGHDWEIYRAVRLQPGEGMSGHVFATEEPYAYQDADYNLFSSVKFPTQGLFQQATQGARLSGGAAVPLKLQGQTIGTLAVGDTAKNVGPRQLELLARLADQVGVAIGRAQAEEALRRREAYHRQLLDDLPIGIAQTTPQGRILYQNPYQLQLLGYTAQELPALRAQDLYLNPADREDLLRNLAERGEHHFEYPLRRKDGQRVWVRGKTRSYQDEHGQPYLLGIAEDVTERKGQALRQQAVQRVREAVWQMRQAADLERVLTILRDQLVANSLVFDDVGVGRMATVAGVPVVHHQSSDGTREWVRWTDDPGGPPSLVTRFWQEGEVVYRRDLAAEDPFEEGHLFLPRIRCIVDVPFSHGTLSVNSQTPEAFSAEDLALLQALAEVLSEGFGRWADLEKLETRVREAEALAAIIAVVAQAGTPEEVFDVVVREAARLTRAERALIFVYDETEKVLVPAVAVGFQGEAYRQIRLLPGEDASGAVFLSGIGQLYDYRQTRTSPTLRPDNQALLAAVGGGQGGSGVVVPLKVAGRVMGTLSVRSGDHQCDERDLAVLEALASQVALALERTTHLRQIENHLQELNQEIIRRQQVEERLQDSEKKYAGIVTASMDAIVSIDAQQRIVLFNPAAEQLFGRSAAEMIGQPLDLLIPARFHAAHAEGVEHFAITEVTDQWMGNQGIITGLRANGEEFPIETFLSRIEIGEEVLLTATLRDITQRQQAERAAHLQLALQRLRNLKLRMETAEEWGVLVAGFHQELQALVPLYWSGFTLIDPEQGSFRVYRSTSMGVEHLTFDTLPTSLLQVLRTGGALYRRNRSEMEGAGDIGIPPEVNSVVDVSFINGTVFMNSTREDAFSVQDIQLLEQFAMVLGEAYQRLRELQLLDQTRNQLYQAQKLEAVGQLAAGIAHNFNNILQANLANISLAMMKGPPKVQEYLREADAAGMRGADLVRQLMAFTRTAVEGVSQQEMDLGTVVGRAVSFVQKVIDRAIELRVEVAPGLPLVQGNAHQLEQALMNLLLNARDALEGVERLTPCIAIRVRPVVRSGPGEAEIRDYLCVEVEDNGTGMDQTTQDRLFEPFFTTKEVGKGTGLGLATVYGIIQGHGGWVECQSQLGEGTTFSLYVPVPAAAEALVSSAEAPFAPGGGGTETLLVIDDEAMVRRSVGTMLTAFGYRVLEAENGLQGLEVYRQERGQVGLVLLDLSMPGLSGREVLRQLRALDPQVKVLVFTGYAVGAEELEGATQVVSKPLSTKQLAITVRQILDS